MPDEAYRDLRTHAGVPPTNIISVRINKTAYIKQDISMERIPITEFALKNGFRSAPDRFQTYGYKRHAYPRR